MYQHCTVTYSAFDPLSSKRKALRSLTYLCINPSTDYPFSDISYRHISRHEPHPTNQIGLATPDTILLDTQIPRVAVEVCITHAKPQYLCQRGSRYRSSQICLFQKDRIQKGRVRKQDDKKTVAKKHKTRYALSVKKKRTNDPRTPR